MCAAVIGTWSLSLPAVRETVTSLQRGDGILDCLERGINVVEDDLEMGDCTVGRGGHPNANGILECDAAIMDGNGCKFGSVTAIQGVPTPLSVARLVMERSSHSMLTGYGAQCFAKECGIPILKNEDLLSNKNRASYQKFLKRCCENNTVRAKSCHDTLGLIVRDFQGNIAAGTSTSGKAFKLSGRVGDSALPGAGLYADNKVGAAAATGDGDDILRFCPCFKVVQLMEQGESSKEACRHVVKSIWKRVGKEKMFEMALIAMNCKGELGTASTVTSSFDFSGSNEQPGFAYSQWVNENENNVEIKYETPVTWEEVENDIS